jgi:hypothetical protein
MIDGGLTDHQWHLFQLLAVGTGLIAAVKLPFFLDENTFLAGRASLHRPLGDCESAVGQGMPVETGAVFPQPASVQR